mgnify:CR=1 FL=1
MLSMTLGSIEWVAGVPEIRLTLSIHGKAGGASTRVMSNPRVNLSQIEGLP